MTTSAQPGDDVEGGFSCHLSGGRSESGAWTVGLLALALVSRRRAA